MIIIMNAHVSDEQISAVEDKLTHMGMGINVSRGIERTVIGAIGDERLIDKELLEALPGVENVIRVMKPYKIVSRESHPENSVINIGGVKLGGNTIHRHPVHPQPSRTAAEAEHGEGSHRRQCSGTHRAA